MSETLTQQIAELQASVSRLEDLIQHQMQETRLLRLNAVLERTGLTRPTLYRMMAEGRFPKPVKPQGMVVALWPAHAVDAWIVKLSAQQEEHPPEVA